MSFEDVLGRRRKGRVTGGWVVFLLTVSTGVFALADERHFPTEELPDSGTWEDDPLRIDTNDGLTTPRERTPAAQTRPNTLTTRLAPQAGEILTAIPGIRETRHDTKIRIERGLAFLSIRTQVTSSAQREGMVEYKLPLPPGAALYGMGVGDNTLHVRETPVSWERTDRPSFRNGELRLDVRIQNAQPRRQLTMSNPPTRTPVRTWRNVRTTQPINEPYLQGAPILHLTFGPVRSSRTVDVTLQLAVVAPHVGGGIRLELPPRGRDARTVAALFEAVAPGYHDVRIRGASADTRLTIDPWTPAVITATMRDAHTMETDFFRFPCGRDVCIWARASAPSKPSAPMDLTLLVDASPSMEGEPRNRVAPVIAGLLALAPSGSRLRAIAFAARAQEIVADWTSMDQLSVRTLAESAMLNLGSRTRLAAVERLLRQRPTTRKHAVVLLSDGGFANEPDYAPILREGPTARVPWYWVNLSSGPTEGEVREAFERTGGATVSLPRTHLTGTLDDVVLHPYLTKVFAPVIVPAVRIRGADGSMVLGALRAGDEISYLGVAPSSPIFWIGNVHKAATATPETHRPALSALWVGSTVLFHLPETPSDGNEARIPSDSLLAMLRQRVIPVARGCFRQDRAGRLAYQSRAEFRFELADREVRTANIAGSLPRQLRECLLRAVDGLDVPRFSGVARIRYPLVTRPEPALPVIELHTDVAAHVDRALGRSSMPPPRP